MTLSVCHDTPCRTSRPHMTLSVPARAHGGEQAIFRCQIHPDSALTNTEPFTEICHDTPCRPSRPHMALSVPARAHGVSKTDFGVTCTPIWRYQTPNAITEIPTTHERHYGTSHRSHMTLTIVTEASERPVDPKRPSRRSSMSRQTPKDPSAHRITSLRAHTHLQHPVAVLSSL